MHTFYRFIAALALFLSLVGIVRAESVTLHLADGTAISGEMVSFDEKGFLLKLADGTYADRTTWGKLAQADLRELLQNPKMHDFVEPFIEITQSDRIKRTEIVWKEVPKLQRPTRTSLAGALFGTGIGLFVLFIVYAGNIYAGYEIAVFRGKPPGMVCGVSAVAPIIGPIIFLSMAPKPIEEKPTSWEVQPPKPPPAQAARPTEEGVLAESIAAEAEAAAAAAAAAPPPVVLPPTKTYARGQFTFNRRFFETQLPKFCAIVRPDDVKDMVLTVRSARGTHVASRISAVSGTDLHLQVEKGEASENVVIPFVEIQEVQVKHKDA